MLLRGEASAVLDTVLKSTTLCRRKRSLFHACRQLFIIKIYRLLPSLYQSEPLPKCNKTDIKIHNFLPRDATLAAVFCCRRVTRVSVRLSIRHKPVLCQNDWTKRVGFRHEGFLQSILH